MKCAIFTLFFSLLVCDSSAQYLPDSVENLLKQGATDRTYLGKNGMYPDSIQWYYFDKTKNKYTELPMGTFVYKYDQNGNVLEEVNQTIKHSFSYSKGRKIDDILLFRNSINSAWVPNRRYQWLCNQFGIDTAEIYSVYDTSALKWVELKWKVYSIDYDLKHRPIRITYRDYSVQNQTWDTIRKIEYTYSGVETFPNEMYRASWDGKIWENERLVTQLSWDLGFFSTIENSYPTSGITHIRDGMNWVKSRYDTAVIVANNTEDYFGYLYDETSMSFVKAGSRHIKYDVHGNRISVVLLNWANGLSDTNSVSLNEFKYGASGEITERVDRYYNKLSTGNKSKYIYYYGSTSLVLTEKLWGNVYPNPVREWQSLFIQSEEIIRQAHLYSYDGVLLRTWNYPTEEGLSMQGLAPGLYFIQLLDGDGNQSTQRIQVY